MYARPRLGDVLVSHSTATLEHLIGIVPSDPHLSCPTQDMALDRGRRMARELGVDAWLTVDHTHFLKVAECRIAETLAQAQPGTNPSLAGPESAGSSHR